MAVKEISKENLKVQARMELEDEIARIREFSTNQPNHEFSIQNQHVLRGDIETWHCGGLISMAGVAWWALNLGITDLSVGLDFKASGGPDWSLSVFTGPVVGTFVVNPNTLPGGKYRFTLGQASFEVGGVNFHLYSMDKKLIATFTGVVGGAGISNISGTGKLSSTKK